MDRTKIEKGMLLVNRINSLERIIDELTDEEDMVFLAKRKGSLAEVRNITYLSEDTTKALVIIFKKEHKALLKELDQL